MEAFGLEGARGGADPIRGADPRTVDPEAFFRAGLALIKRGRPKDAVRAFRSALEVQPAEPRYRSFYGRCLASAGGNLREALAHCREAADAAFYRPELHLNLGKVLLLSGRVNKAVEAFRQGLSLDAQNREIIRELERLGVRKPPVLPFLARKNPLNRWLGRVRHRVAPSEPKIAR